MAAAPITAASVIVGSFDFSPFTGNITESPGSVSMKEVPTFASGGYVVRVPSIKSGTFGLSGYCDHTNSTGINSAMSAALGTQYAVQISTPGTAAGDVALLGRGVCNHWMPMQTDPDNPASFEFGLATDAAFTFGKLAAPLASRTTSGLTGTAVALIGPTASQSLYAALNITAASGTNLVVKVQSDDNSGFTSATDRITFSTASAVGWQWSSVAGDLSTETYWRVVATIASGTFSFAVSFGVA